MPSRLVHVILVSLAVVLSLISLVPTVRAQTVWSGLTLSFSKPDGVDGTLSENQDQITDHVRLARGSSAGLYNDVAEIGWNGSGPKLTKWATTLVAGNEELTENEIVATNFANLEFTDWLPAYGGGGDNALHERIQGRRAVLYLVDDNTYLDIQFSYWGAGHFGGAGGFAYMRSEPPSTPVTTGDYNGNLVVDAADYTLWRNSFGDQVTPGNGADGFADGLIDQQDYTFWKTRFGNVILMGSGGIASAAVPEPASCLLLLGGWLIIATARKCAPRGPGQ